jgi:hypothetical protein
MRWLSRQRSPGAALAAPAWVAFHRPAKYALKQAKKVKAALVTRVHPEGSDTGKTANTA